MYHKIEKSIIPLDNYSRVPNDNFIKPNILSRTELFSVAKTSDISFLNTPIFRTRSLEIKQSGPKLNLLDSSVWLYCLYIYRMRDISEKTKINFADMIRIIGGKDNKKSNYKTLRNSIDKLSQTTLEVNYWSKYKTKVRLLYSSDKKRKENDRVIYLDENIYKLFLKQEYSNLSIYLRQQLKGDLTKWLYDYVRSHKREQTMCVGLELLKLLSGSKMTKGEFHRTIKDSFKQLSNLEVVKDVAFNQSKYKQQVSWYHIHRKPQYDGDIPF